jgi:hypothetical protein
MQPWIASGHASLAVAMTPKKPLAIGETALSRGA